MPHGEDSKIELSPLKVTFNDEYLTCKIKKKLNLMSNDCYHSLSVPSINGLGNGYPDFSWTAI